MEKGLSRNEELKTRWENLVIILSNKFSDGKPLDVEGILYLVGLQELGQIHRKMKKMIIMSI